MDNLNTRQLPNVLLRLRKTKELSQQDVAKVLGISKAHYSRIENGERPVQDTQLVALSKLFQYDLESLRAIYLADKLKEETEKYSEAEVETAIKILTSRN